MKSLQKDRRPDGLHPSGLRVLGNNPQTCLRSVAYRIKFPLRNHPAAPLSYSRFSIYEQGHDTHGKLLGWLSWAYPSRFTSEVEIEIPELHIVGVCDGIYDDGVNRIVLEIKSINEEGFNALQKPKREHIEQAAMYVAALKADGVVVLYENKNNQELKEFFLSDKETEPIYRAIETTLRQIIDDLGHGLLPAPNVRKSECNSCPFKIPCDPFGDGYAPSTTRRPAD